MGEKVLGVRTKASAAKQLKMPASMEGALQRRGSLGRASSQGNCEADEDEGRTPHEDDLEEVLEGFTPRRLAALGAEQELEYSGGRRKSGGSLVQPPLLFEPNSVKSRP